jgi:ribosomal protein S12 methylthiotransferase
MRLQQRIALEFGESLVGYELDVLIDREFEPGMWIGRSYADAPEIDGVVYVRGAGLSPGDLVPVELIEADGYDLVGDLALPEADSGELAIDDGPTDLGASSS